MSGNSNNFWVRFILQTGLENSECLNYSNFFLFFLNDSSVTMSIIWPTYRRRLAASWGTCQCRAECWPGWNGPPPASRTEWSDCGSFPPHPWHVPPPVNPALERCPPNQWESPGPLKHTDRTVLTVRTGGEQTSKKNKKMKKKWSIWTS